MKILALHSDFIEFEAKKKAIKDPEELKNKKEKVDECLVVLTSVEKRDETHPENAAKNLVKHIKEIASQVKEKRVVLYPYVHLTNEPSSPKVALQVLDEAEKELKNDFEVHRSPFGWYKAFNISVKGHPLSELSREFGPEDSSSAGSNETYDHLIKFLDENKANYRLIGHAPEGRTEFASKLRGNKVSEAAHCIIIMIKAGKKEKKFVLAVVPGDARVDLDAIKELYKGSYASFADTQDAEKLGGSVSGTILPFSFNEKLELVVDPRLLENDELYFNAARLDRSLALKKDDYVRITNPRQEKIAKYDKPTDDESDSLKKERKLTSYWNILDVDGTLHEVDKFNYKGHEKLKKFAFYEKEKSRAVKQEPPHVALMKKLELVDYEPASDGGNLRYYPKGRLMKKLIEEYVTDRVVDYGGVEVETPLMYDMNHPTLSKYLARFPARQYQIESDKRKFFLRFAACFGQFLMAHDATISYKDLPLKLYELTRYSFRREQSGELTGLRRLRAFTMPDVHALVADLKQAMDEFKIRFGLSLSVLNEMGIGNTDLEMALRTTKDFFEKNKEFILALVKKIGKPILLETWDERIFYFILKYEFNFVDNLDKASALSTDQIDIENGERYDINFTDKDGQKKHPLILHCSPSGAIERVMYTLLEKAAFDMKEGKTAKIPLWLNPTQVRVIPVSEEFNDYAMKVTDDLRANKIRADIDDRSLHVGKKIREAGTSWCSYVVVIGENEKKSGKLAVRLRGEKDPKDMKAEELIKEIHDKTKGMPWKPLALPKELSKRPIFVG